MTDTSDVPPGLSSVDAAVEAIGRGGMVVVFDDASRENEGDLVCAAELATAEVVDFMAKYGRGLVCVPMERQRLEHLAIPQMVERSNDRHGTAFHIGVDLRIGTTTGISAADRASTVRALADPTSIASDFTRPGHTFPLAYADGGVLERAGHTEASIDLVRLAGLRPASVICEIAGEDGEMMRLPELVAFAARHGLPIIAIRDLRMRLTDVRLVKREAEARVPVAQGDFRLVGYRDAHDGREHVAAVLGDVRGRQAVVARVHSECLSGDVFGSRRCDCGEQLQLAMSMIAEAGAGVVVYLRGHEGRGIGLVEKLKAYALQDAGLDTLEANLALGYPADLRDYTIGAEILADLGVQDVRLLTNNPAKRCALEEHGISVRECVPLLTKPTVENLRYLSAKRSKLGHVLPFESFAETPI